jgi:hypothetical protein
VHREPAPKRRQLRPFALELEPAHVASETKPSQHEHPVTQVEHELRQPLPSLPCLVECLKTFEEAGMTAERPAQAERLELGVELELDVWRIADQDELEVPTGGRIPAGNDRSAQQRRGRRERGLSRRTPSADSAR